MSYSSILKFPNELIERIAQCLDHKDILNFRLVSRQMHNGSLHDFAERYFQHVFLFLHPACIQCLAQIAARPELSSKVKKLTITNDRLHVTVSRQEPKSIQELQRMERISWRHGDDVKLLRHILPLLKNLEEIRVTCRPLILELQGPRINCGNVLLEALGIDDVDEWFSSPLWSRGFGNMPLGHAWEVVIQAISAADGNVTLDIDMGGDMGAQNPWCHFFNTVSPAWETAKHRVRRINMNTHRKSVWWVQDCLESVRDVAGVEIILWEDTRRACLLRVRSLLQPGFSDVRVTPGLQRLTLAYLELEPMPYGYYGLTPRALPALRSLEILHCRWLNDKSWGQLLDEILNLKLSPNLEFLFFKGIYIRPADGMTYGMRRGRFGLGASRKSNRIALKGWSEIEKGVLALMEHAFLAPMHFRDFPFHTDQGYYIVDMREAISAFNGEDVD